MATSTEHPSPVLRELWLNRAKIVLRGTGQVMFQGHAGTGLLFLIGIAAASPWMAVGAVVGAVLGPLIARCLKFDRKEIEDGIYGFNGTLVGIALFFYERPSSIDTWVLMVVGCALAPLVTYLMRRHLKFPTYTAPFIVTTWVVMLAGYALAGSSLDIGPSPAPVTPHQFIEEVIDGVAEVMFGANMITGLCFVAGLAALSNWRHALLAVLGSVVGTLQAIYHHDPEGTISIGIYGYNAALAAIALFLWRKSIVLPILAAVVSVPLTEFFPHFLNVHALTAPFVLASWIVIAALWLEGYLLKERAVDSTSETAA